MEVRIRDGKIRIGSYEPGPLWKADEKLYRKFTKGKPDAFKSSAEEKAERYSAFRTLTHRTAQHIGMYGRLTLSDGYFYYLLVYTILVSIGLILRMILILKR